MPFAPAIPAEVERYAKANAVLPVAIHIRGHNGPDVGLPETITYNLTLTLPDGTTFDWDGLSPSFRMWEAPMNIVAAGPPKPARLCKAHGLLVGGSLMWFVTEAPKSGPCPPPGGA